MKAFPHELSKVTVADALSAFARGIAWLVVIWSAAMALGFAWTWQLIAICIVSVIADFVINRRARSTSSDS